MAMKRTRLTVRTSYYNADSPTKIWESFSPIVVYWFKDRKDGPAWISETEKVWYDNGRQIKGEKR